MMKYKMSTAAICLAAFLSSILAGCQLAREDAGANASEDRLIGIFLTTEHLDLFDFDGYLKDNIGNFSGGKINIDGNAEKYQGRLYAELKTKTLTNAETGEKTETTEYVFPNFKGITFFSTWFPVTVENSSCYTTVSDEEISDGRVDVKQDDQGSSITMEGTIYVTPGHVKAYFFNPVYQSSDGSVYAMTGHGISASGDSPEGTAYSQTLDAAYTTAENEKTKKDSISVKISVSVMNPPEKIVVLQMGADGSLVFRTEYNPGEMPEAIVPEKNTEYFIVETKKASNSGDGTISRKLYGKDADTLEAFYCRKDGICVKQRVQIKWSR